MHPFPRPLQWQEIPFTFQNPQQETLNAMLWQNPQATEAQHQRILVFIPGLGGSASHAKPILSPLIDQFDAILSVDCRGFGHNKHLSLWHIADIFADLTHFTQTVLPTKLAEQGLAEAEVVLSGISLGGLMSTYLAATFPQVYQRLILLVPAYKANMQAFPLMWVVSNLLKLALTKDKQSFFVWLPYGVDAITRNPLYLNGDRPAPEVPLYINMQFLKTVKDWTGSQLNHTIQAVKQPVFMCVAGVDKVSSTPEMVKRFKQLPPHPQHRLLTVPEAFHDVILEPEAPWIAQAISHWLGYPETVVAPTQAPVTIGRSCL